MALEMKCHDILRRFRETCYWQPTIVAEVVCFTKPNSEHVARDAIDLMRCKYAQFNSSIVSSPKYHAGHINTNSVPLLVPYLNKHSVSMACRRYSSSWYVLRRSHNLPLWPFSCRCGVVYALHVAIYPFLLPNVFGAFCALLALPLVIFGIPETRGLDRIRAEWALHR